MYICVQPSFLKIPVTYGLENIALGMSAMSSIAPENAVSGYPLNHTLMLRLTKQEHAPLI